MDWSSIHEARLSAYYVRALSVAARADRRYTAGSAHEPGGTGHESEWARFGGRPGPPLMEEGLVRERRVGSKSTRGRTVVVALVLAGLLSLWFVTARVAKAYPVSSDDATGMLEASSVLRGNLLLRGWTVSNVSFAATDLPYYVAGVAVRGLHPALLRDVPSAVYTVAVGFAAVLAAARGRSAGL